MDKRGGRFVITGRIFAKSGSCRVCRTISVPNGLESDWIAHAPESRNRQRQGEKGNEDDEEGQKVLVGDEPFRIASHHSIPDDPVTEIGGEHSNRSLTV